MFTATNQLNYKDINYLHTKIANKKGTDCKNFSFHLLNKVKSSIFQTIKQGSLLRSRIGILTDARIVELRIDPVFSIS